MVRFCLSCVCWLAEFLRWQDAGEGGRWALLMVGGGVVFALPCGIQRYETVSQELEAVGAFHF